MYVGPITPERTYQNRCKKNLCSLLSGQDLYYWSKIKKNRYDHVKNYDGTKFDE